jgi:hypothetical protein
MLQTIRWLIKQHSFLHRIRFARGATKIITFILIVVTEDLLDVSLVYSKLVSLNVFLEVSSNKD